MVIFRQKYILNYDQEKKSINSLYLCNVNKMKHTTPLINNDWDIILKDEFQKVSFKELTQLVANEREKYTVFPSIFCIFHHMLR